MSIDGLLNVAKPSGRTSFSVVSMVRRWSRERRVGHAGTLDPDATGVLVVCLGQATRIVEYLSDNRKTYRAGVRLGLTTDTYDASGRVVSERDPSSITWEQVSRTLSRFLGSQDQIPPMHSAVHYNGRRLYELARKGIEVERRPRSIEVYRISLLEWHPPMFTVEIECGGGTYVRSLAHDIGEALGCGAVLESLVRLRSGSFCLEEAVAFEQLEEAFRDGTWHRYLHGIDEVLLRWPAAILDAANQSRIKNGLDIELHLPSSTGTEEDHCRAYSSEGDFLAVLTRAGPDRWHPEKVFSAVKAQDPA